MGGFGVVGEVLQQLKYTHEKIIKLIRTSSIWVVLQVRGPFRVQSSVLFGGDLERDPILANYSSSKKQNWLAAWPEVEFELVHPPPGPAACPDPLDIGLRVQRLYSRAYRV